MSKHTLVRRELDFVLDNEDNMIEEVHEYALRFGCSAKIVKEAGPAGGHPVVEFAGTPENMSSLLAHYNGSDDAPAG